MVSLRKTASPGPSALRTNVLVGGGYAWSATVAWPSWTLGTSWPVLVSASLSLLSLVIGVFIGTRWAALGRGLTLYGFVGWSAFTWYLLGPALDPEAVSPLHAALGGVGWMLFTFAWGAVRRAAWVPEDAPNAIVGEPLLPREHPSRLAMGAMALGIGGALVVWAMAWRVQSGVHAPLAQAAGLLCAVALLTVAPELATSVGRHRPSARARVRLRRALPALIGALLLGVLGLVRWLR